MDMSGLLHAPAALPLGKEPQYFLTHTAILRDSHDISESIKNYMNKSCIFSMMCYQRKFKEDWVRDFFYYHV
jgi:hypothetical protein